MGCKLQPFQVCTFICGSIQMKTGNPSLACIQSQLIRAVGIHFTSKFKEEEKIRPPSLVTFAEQYKIILCI